MIGNQLNEDDDLSGRFIEDKRVRPGIGRRGLLKFFGAAAIVAPAAAVAAKAEAKSMPSFSGPSEYNEFCRESMASGREFSYPVGETCCTMMVGSDGEDALMSSMISGPGETVRFEWSDEPDDDY